MKNSNNLFNIKLPEVIFFSSIFLVLLSFLLFYLIDLRNFLGTRDYLFSLNLYSFDFNYWPLFFVQWGRNGGLAEIIQALLLASSVIISAFIASYERFKSKKRFYFWLLMTIAFSLMLIEDAGEVRMVFVSYFQAFFGEMHQGTIGTFVEFVYFFILAFIPVYAILAYGKFLFYLKKTRIYMLIGFSFYFLAASLSYLGRFVFEISLYINKEFYTLLGEMFYNFSLKIGDDNLFQAWTNDLYLFFYEFYSLDTITSFIQFNLLDSLVEENIELIGAAAFLAAVTSYLIYQNNERKKLNKYI